MRSLVVLAVAAVAGCSIPRVDIGAMRAGAPAPAIQSKWMTVAFTTWTPVQLVDAAGNESPWMRVGLLYLDEHSVCVDADVERWKFVVSFAVRAPDARLIESITRPVAGVTVSRSGADWVLRGEPMYLRAWFGQHVAAVDSLERSEPGVQRARYYVGRIGAIHWSASDDPMALLAGLDGRGMRVGWHWDDVAQVRALPGIAGSTANDAAYVAQWLRPDAEKSASEKTATGPKWLPVACPSGDRAPQRYAAPPVSAADRPAS
jgi:hypothetical protein